MEKIELFELYLTVVELDLFLELKDRLMFPPFSALPPHGQWYILETDACDYQIERAVLQQQPSGEKIRLGYWSRSLSASDKNYHTTEE